MRVSSGGFSVAWEKYKSTICTGFQELQQRGEFVDMTIAADGHLVRAHQMVVGLASPFLKELLKSAPSPHPVLFLNNVSHKILCCILEYMYTGETFVPADDLKAFIITGKNLHVKGLEDMLETGPPLSKAREDSEVLEAAVALTCVASEQSASGTISAPTKGNESLIRNVSHPTSSKPIAVSSKESLPRVVKDVNVKITNNSILNRDMASVVPATVEKRDMEIVDTISDNSNDGDEIIMDESEERKAEPNSGPIKTTLENQDALPKKPKLMYTVSNQGRLQVIVNRCMFRVRNKYKDGRRRWECVEDKPKCNAMVITSDESILARYNYHNHAFHDKKIMAKVKKGLVFTSIKKAEENMNI